MIYTPLTERAMRVMYAAHAGQVDRAGVPYVFHPWHVAEEQRDELCTCAALLHDVLEDTAMTEQDLRRQDFPPEVVEAVCLLTRPEGMEYMAYVRRLSGNPIARRVKIADLRHNSDLSRLHEVTEQDLCRAGKYRKALDFLLEVESGRRGG